MEYRKLPHGGEQISIIGLGNSSIGVLSEGEIEDTDFHGIGKWNQFL